MKKLTSIFALTALLILCSSGVSKVFAGAASVPTFSVSGGWLMIEAEDTYITSGRFTETVESTASGGKVLLSAATYTSPTPAPSIAGAEFKATVEQTTTYYLWVLASATDGGNDSVYAALDGATYTNCSLAIDATGKYNWTRILTTSSLTANTTYTVRLHPRESGTKIDKILFTTSSTAPLEIPNILIPAPEVTLPPNAYPMPTITPPSSHPRILFTSSDRSNIKINMSKAKNAAAKSKHDFYLGQSFSMPANNYYNGETFSMIESWAFDYAVNGTVAQGYKAIHALFSYMPVVNFSTITSDVTRAHGQVIFTASEVYDWCYPLLTEEQKYSIRYYCELIAKLMEIGYPPNKQGAVVGHGGEAQLMRDQLAFGIATYQERPDIYNYVAGRYLSQFIQTRNYWYDSHTHHQGSAYGPYRFSFDLWGNVIYKKMAGQNVFSEQGEFIPFHWIYTRRPDGQLFREGDDFSERGTGSNLSKYWTIPAKALFYAAASWENPYVRWQFERIYPSYNSFSHHNDTLTPVQILILNNPDAPTKSPADLPLSKYFGSPSGTMIARTGWDDATTNANNSDDVIAYMKIGEVWAANHQHLDAGTFQLYYKGILASESGQYDSYNTTHDQNYNKETIAHNSLLIYNPSESIYGGAVNSGGQRRGGGEPSTMSNWITNTTAYKTGEVIDYGFGPDPITPEYTYIKGDITKAYTNKVSEVLRSMLFIPLEDSNYPAAFFVMDKITASNPAYKKTWLLHTQEAPSVNGNTTTVVRTKKNGVNTYYNGRMHVQTLLPANASITPIGGSGNEFNINGTNYAPLSASGTGNEPGWGRVEVSPPNANATDYFFNVMCVSDNSKNLSALPSTLIETDTVAGAKISDRAVLFGKNKTHMVGPISFTIPGNGSESIKVLVAGAAEGIWTIYRNSELKGELTASEQDGVLYFDGNPGDYTFLRISSGIETSLRSLAYNGTPVMLEPFKYDYQVNLPVGTTTVPTVSAQTTYATASIAITQATTIPGTATVVVTSQDGLTSQAYTVHFSIPDLVNTDLADLSYTFHGEKQLISLTNDNLNTTLQENRYIVTLPYITRTFTANRLPTVDASPVTLGATVAITQAATFPGTAKITVTSLNGTKKNYYVRFRDLPGSIINVNNKMSTQAYQAFHDLQPMSLTNLRELYLDSGADWQDYCRIYVDRGTVGVATQCTDASMIPAANAPYTGTGEFLSDYTGSWFYMWLSTNTRYGNTSQLFDGASWIATGNNEKSVPYMIASNPDAITFTIDRAATVYVASAGGASANFTNNGWTYRSSTTNRIMQGDGSIFPACFIKHFDAGMVNIPSTGNASGAGHRMFIPLIVWDAPGTGDTSLTSLTATINDTPQDIPITGESNYTIKAPSDSLPVISAVCTDPNAQIDIIQPTSVPGNAIITVISGGNTKAYIVAVELSGMPAPAVTADDIANLIVGFDYLTMEYAISADGGLSYSEYTSDTLLFLSGSKMVKVRYKSENDVPNEDTVLVFTPNAGDINGDGNFDVTDVIMVAEIAVGHSGYTSEQILRASVSDQTNTTVDISDVVLLLQRALGDNSPFPVEIQ